MNSKFVYFDLIVIGSCALVLSLALMLFGLLSLINRGSGRAVAAPPDTDETIYPGDGRR